MFPHYILEFTPVIFPPAFFAPPHLVPPPYSESLPGCVVAARYKAESLAIPFRSERSNRWACCPLDSQDLNVLTTMTLLLPLPGLTLK